MSSMCYYLELLRRQVREIRLAESTKPTAQCIIDIENTELSRKIKNHIEGYYASPQIRPILNYVWKKINASEHKTELVKRFVEEISDCIDNQCVTPCKGAINARLVNVMVGFINYEA